MNLTKVVFHCYLSWPIRFFGGLISDAIWSSLDMAIDDPAVSMAEPIQDSGHNLIFRLHQRGGFAQFFFHGIRQDFKRRTEHRNGRRKKFEDASVSTPQVYPSSPWFSPSSLKAALGPTIVQSTCGKARWTRWPIDKLWVQQNSESTSHCSIFLKPEASTKTNRCLRWGGFNSQGICRSKCGSHLGCFGSNLRTQRPESFSELD